MQRSEVIRWEKLQLNQRMVRADIELNYLDSFRSKKGSPEVIEELNEEALTCKEMADKNQLSHYDTE
jgi:hypothetical protein